MPADKTPEQRQAAELPWGLTLYTVSAVAQGWGKPMAVPTACRPGSKAAIPTGTPGPRGSESPEPRRREAGPAHSAAEPPSEGQPSWREDKAVGGVWGEGSGEGVGWGSGPLILRGVWFWARWLGLWGSESTRKTSSSPWPPTPAHLWVPSQPVAWRTCGQRGALPKRSVSMANCTAERQQAARSARDRGSPTALSTPQHGQSARGPARAPRVLGEQSRDAADRVPRVPAWGPCAASSKGRLNGLSRTETPLWMQVSTVQGSTGTSQLGEALPRSRETGGPHHPQRLLLCLSWGERGDSNGQVSWVSGTGW